MALAPVARESGSEVRRELLRKLYEEFYRKARFWLCVRECIESDSIARLAPWLVFAICVEECREG